MDSIHVKVTPETLVSVSQQVTGKIVEVQKAFDDINDVIQKTASYWEGDGQAQCLQYYQTRKEDYSRILREFKTHAENLSQIAGGYTQVETKATALAQTLLEDVIF